MFDTLPQGATALSQWSWSQIEPYYHDLATRPLDRNNVSNFLMDWTRLSERVDEMQARLLVATTLNTTDQEAERRYHTYLDEVYPAAEAAEQRLKEKLLGSGLEPAGFELPLQKMRTEAALFRQANLPLLTEEHKLSAQYDRIIGAQTVEWAGQEVTLAQLQPVYQNPDRAQREQAWRLAAERQLADREAINGLWQNFLGLRQRIAVNADLGDYRAFCWQKLLRFDYTPADCLRFHQAIEAEVVPAARRIYEKRRQRLGVNSLRPWDLEVDPLGRPPLRPFHNALELQTKSLAIFQRLDPQLAAYFETMVNEDLLDLDNRKNKAPGGYCMAFAAVKRPFIFMNAVGLHDDVQTMLHEAGHAFHVFETNHLPYFQQLQVGEEFGEVASMAMEWLAAPYLSAPGSFYNPAEAARARLEHLERSILFWPYMAVVDAFQHWVYENPAAAMNPANCDAHWVALWQRFMPGLDWSGLEQELMTGWQRKLHIHQVPFYYVEYGLAQLGAVQVWRNALTDQAEAVASYRRALALGGTVSLPQLYATAGAKFAFDGPTLGSAINLIEETIAALEAV
ncbi:MAG TPA: M3 family oligoendopeptidase [Anaerolineae bacterium]|nr:M3 family oligoendopeptidase [Anaerolineae bacterium]